MQWLSYTGIEMLLYGKICSKLFTLKQLWICLCVVLLNGSCLWWVIKDGISSRLGYALAAWHKSNCSLLESSLCSLICRWCWQIIIHSSTCLVLCCWLFANSFSFSVVSSLSSVSTVLWNCSKCMSSRRVIGTFPDWRYDVCACTKFLSSPNKSASFLKGL